MVAHQIHNAGDRPVDGSMGVRRRPAGPQLHGRVQVDGDGADDGRRISAATQGDARGAHVRVPGKDREDAVFSVGAD